MATVTRTVADYDRAFDEECRQVYNIVDSIEREYGHAVNGAKLLRAARVLACPVKANPPNWQHGRVLYAVARNYLSVHRGPDPANLIDIGTAKGFSALCLRWALEDSGVSGRVHSCDVVPPAERAWRNTVLEAGRETPMTLAEILADFPESEEIKFYGGTGVQLIRGLSSQRVNLAFVDGKHEGVVVRQEANMIRDLQQSGDVIIFDDVHIADVYRAAVLATERAYTHRVVPILHNRQYLICRRKS